jgi:nickel-dependent lactate racemase
MAPYILESLHRAGMKEDQILFIWALGAHEVNSKHKIGSVTGKCPVLPKRDRRGPCLPVGPEP